MNFLERRRCGELITADDYRHLPVMLLYLVYQVKRCPVTI